MASQSPRRRQLLAEAGFQFSIRTYDVEETYPDDMPAEEVAVYLARKKAGAGAADLREGEVLLTADSVVILDGEIFGKPRDYDDAFRMLRRLSGQTHTVITGVCLMNREKQKSFAGVSKVTFAALNDAEIEFYLKEYQPYDKAGSYGVQDWIGLCKVVRIEGTYANVMGLPVDLVYEALGTF
ncbi:MAG TPA: Maf family nucleotide pyrophosphatase [Saprospiraceae bacterium]|nr:Maf family nucleotide pyrophosphatase [Saprospiraceae bacterium]HNM27448.1 Maf family nucleotide pyrophosphatase [Saprospiraceae bacterium]